MSDTKRAGDTQVLTGITSDVYSALDAARRWGFYDLERILNDAAAEIQKLHMELDARSDARPLQAKGAHHVYSGR